VPGRLRSLPLVLLTAACTLLWIAPVALMLADFSWANARILIDNYPLLRWYRNSLVTAAATTMLVVVSGSLAGYAFARIPFRGREPLFYGLLLALLVPPEMTIIPLFLAFSRLGLADTYAALVLPQVANALTLLLFREFFRRLPSEVEDAARIDGASRLGVYWRIVLPLSWPVLATVAIVTFVASWNDFLWPLIITRTDATITLPVGMHQWDMLEGAVLVALPAVSVFLVLSRSLMRGISLGR